MALLTLLEYIDISAQLLCGGCQGIDYTRSLIKDESPTRL